MTVALQTLLDSFKNMGSGMNSVVKASALEMIKRAYKEGIYAQISAGYRSMEEQAALYTEGYNPGSLDSIFGKDTELALSKFQKAKKIPADKKAGEATFTELFAV
ncbi:peptidoglycan-binding protein [Peribacillus sp. NPDC058075]|uniref:peptidoglycan-binding protein n=1 Tax=unclassified Peribacillus TaxID=2675266 RepID=UPI0036DC3863